MGISSAAGIFQSIITNIFHGMGYAFAYLDDIFLKKGKGEPVEEHLGKIEKVCARLEEHGFRASLRKSFFMQKEIGYLGYLLAPGGLRAQPKKIEAIKRILPPKKIGRAHV